MFAPLAAPASQTPSQAGAAKLLTAILAFAHGPLHYFVQLITLTEVEGTLSCEEFVPARTAVTKYV